MRIRFAGASGGEVTGSCYIVETKQACIVIDAGMFQGGRSSELRNKMPPGLHVRDIDAVLLTHGHLDHTGRLPLMTKLGYNAPVYATKATLDISHLILMDSARLQASDAMRRNRRNRKRGEPPEEALYHTEHVEFIGEIAKSVELNSPVVVAPGITARWVEAGHMLGSGSIELIVNEGSGKPRVIIFSGDLGPLNFPLLREYERLKRADAVIMESTYGDRDHKSYEQTIDEFEDIIRDAAGRKGRILIPSFAVGRAQQIIYHVAEMFHDRKVKPFPVVLDSPMAIEAIKVYAGHQHLFDEEFQTLRKRGVFPLNRRYFQTSPTAETSRRLNELKGPCVILAGAGMCNGGRILHHLYHHLDDPDTHVMIVGYQSYDSLGRRLVEGATHVNIFGDSIPVRARIETLNGFSAHAGQSELIHWYASLAPSKPQLFLTHGEDGPRKALAEKLKKKFAVKARLPALSEVAEV
jgi:metallo-beta-lactamase family protein